MELKLSGATNKPKVFANKRTMNFVRRESSVNWKKVGIVGGIVLVIVGLFVKFGIIDQLTLKKQAQDANSSAKMQLAMINEQMVQYNEVKAEYDRYSDARYNENERYLIDPMDAFDFLNEELFADYAVTPVTVRSNKIFTRIDGISLAELSDLILKLEEHELVEHVIFSSANSLDSDTASVSLEIRVVKGGTTNEEG